MRKQPTEVTRELADLIVKVQPDWSSPAKSLQFTSCL